MTAPTATAPDREQPERPGPGDPAEAGTGTAADDGFDQTSCPARRVRPAPCCAPC